MPLPAANALQVRAGDGWLAAPERLQKVRMLLLHMQKPLAADRFTTSKIKGQRVFETLINLMGHPVLQFLGASSP